MALQKFIARFNAPGFHESETIFAEDKEAADRRAEAIALEPRAGWPYCNQTPGFMRIEVVPVAAPVLNSQAAE